VSERISKAVEIFKNSGASDSEAKEVVNGVLLRLRLSRNPEEFSASYLFAEDRDEKERIRELLGDAADHLITDTQRLRDYFVKRRASLKARLVDLVAQDDMSEVPDVASYIDECDQFIDRLGAIN